MAYVMMVELLESRSQSMFISSVIARTSGNTDVQVITPQEAREQFDAWLLTPPKETDSDQAILMAALFPRR